MIRQKRRPHVLKRITKAPIAQTHAALIAHAVRIHDIDATSSLPQSIEGLNVSNEPPFRAVAP